MPDKHEVGGSSPLGPTSVQCTHKQNKSAGTTSCFPRALSSSTEEQKELGGRDAEPKEETPRQVARDKHRLSEMVDPTLT